MSLFQNSLPQAGKGKPRACVESSIAVIREYEALVFGTYSIIVIDSNIRAKSEVFANTARQRR
jgi:hypothetical protein